MNNNKKYRKAFCALMIGTAIYAFPGPVHAQITTTTETSSASGPNATPSVSASSSTQVCPPAPPGDGGDDPDGESSNDSDGDGQGDNDAGVGPSVSGPSDGTGPSSPSGEGDPGDGDKILCTHFYHKNLLPEYVYNADIMYSKIHVKDSVRNGYHAWAIPVVRYLRAHPDGIVEKVAYFLVRHWAQEMAYIMEVSDQRSLLGQVMRLVGEPACGVLGKLVGDQDWKSLYRNRSLAQISIFK